MSGEANGHAAPPPRLVIHDAEFDAASRALYAALEREQADAAALAGEYASHRETFVYLHRQLVAWFLRPPSAITQEKTDTLRRIVHALGDAARLTGAREG